MQDIQHLWPIHKMPRIFPNCYNHKHPPHTFPRVLQRVCLHSQLITKNSCRKKKENFFRIIFNLFSLTYLHGTSFYFNSKQSLVGSLLPCQPNWDSLNKPQLLRTAYPNLCCSLYLVCLHCSRHCLNPSQLIKRKPFPGSLLCSPSSPNPSLLQRAQFCGSTVHTPFRSIIQGLRCLRKKRRFYSRHSRKPLERLKVNLLKD